MAIITEEHEEEHEEEQQQPPPKQQKSPNNNLNTEKRPQNSNPFIFWFYVTLFISLITLISIFFSSIISSQDPKSWFLSLPNSLRRHYSLGRVIKIQTNPNRSPFELFTVQSGPKSAENVLIIHGLGLSSFEFRDLLNSLGSKGVRVTAIDLPGNGFSDRSTVEIEERSGGVFDSFSDVYGLIQEKGFFWAFDQMIETGQIPYEEILKSRVSGKKVDKVIELGSEELSRVLGQVIETLNLSPVHLVLHDSALSMTANWISENSASIRSVTLIDTKTRPAFPLVLLDFPMIRNFLLGSRLAYERLIKLCCVKENGGFDVEANRVLLKGRDRSKAVAEIGRNLNYSFDIGEWGGSDGVKDLPMQVIWSKEWSEEDGNRAKDSLPQAKFVKHSGGMWPQEDNADELAETIADFVSSLPKSVRQTKEELIPEHIQKMFDEAQHGDHHNHGHGGHAHHHHDGQSDGAEYMDAYGLGQAWGS